MVRAAVVALALIAALPAPLDAAEDVHSGNYMLKACGDAGEAYELAYCMGKLDAFDAGYEMAHTIGDPMPYCTPDGATNGQKKDIYLAYLKAHPERRHVYWALLYLHALSDAWPCTDGQRIEWMPAEQTIRIIPARTK